MQIAVAFERTELKFQVMNNIEGSFGPRSVLWEERYDGSLAGSKYHIVISSIELA